MLAGLRRRVVSRPRRARTHAPDAGFTLTEVLVSMMLVGVVMGALTTFYARSMSVTSYQRGKQTAVQLASSGMERVRALKAADLTSPQPTTPPCVLSIAAGGLDPGLQLWDHDCPNLGISYNRYWYVGDCWQPAGGGPCTQTTDAVKLTRVVVAVAWHDKSCQNSACTYATSTLVNADTDPIFDPAAKALPPTVQNPGPQSGEVSVPVNVRIIGSGAAPLTFFAAAPPKGLPDGLSMDSTGLVTGTPTKAGEYPVAVSATDGFGNTGSTSFTWKVVPTPQFGEPGTQATGKSLPVSFQVPLISGTGIGPFTWSVAAPGSWGTTGLPPGLRIDAKTGVISGTPTTIGPPKAVTVTVTDANGKSGSVTFPWTVGPTITLPAEHTDPTHKCFDNLRATATADGTAPYRWSPANLPDGLSMDPNGVFKGCIARGVRYLPTITVTDNAGAASSLTFEWLVDDPNGLHISGPSARTDQANQAIPDSVSISVIGGKPSYTTKADGLPPGVALNGLTFTGTPTTAGTYLVTVTYGKHTKTAKYLFVWTIR